MAACIQLLRPKATHPKLLTAGKNNSASPRQLVASCRDYHRCTHISQSRTAVTNVNGPLVQGDQIRVNTSWMTRASIRSRLAALIEPRFLQLDRLERVAKSWNGIAAVAEPTASVGSGN